MPQGNRRLMAYRYQTPMLNLAPPLTKVAPTENTTGQDWRDEKKTARASRYAIVSIDCRRRVRSRTSQKHKGQRGLSVRETWLTRKVRCSHQSLPCRASRRLFRPRADPETTPSRPWLERQGGPRVISMPWLGGVTHHLHQHLRTFFE